MRKISLVAAIALMLAGVAAWATSTTEARLDAPAVAQINPSQIMMGAKHLPPWSSIERASLLARETRTRKFVTRNTGHVDT